MHMKETTLKLIEKLYVCQIKKNKPHFQTKHIRDRIKIII